MRYSASEQPGPEAKWRVQAVRKFAIPQFFRPAGLAAILTASLLSGCAPAPRPAEKTKVDPTQEAWYAEGVQQLAAMNLQAQGLLKRGKADDAAAVITAGEPWANRLLSVPHPTLAAMEAASDLDELYGHMLLANHNYGWARMMFQKNRARWKNWRPQTEETTRHLKVTEAAIAECDRRMAE
jgi:hypothetical protein